MQPAGDPQAAQLASGHPARAASAGLGAATGESATRQEQAARFVSSCLIKCLPCTSSKQGHSRPRPSSGAHYPSGPPALSCRPGCSPAAQRPPGLQPLGPDPPSAALGDRPLCLRVLGPREGLSEVAGASSGAQWDGLCPEAQVCSRSPPRGRRAGQTPRGGLEPSLSRGCGGQRSALLSRPLLPGSLAVKVQPPDGRLQ